MRNIGATSLSGSFTITKLILSESGIYNERYLRSLKFGTVTDATIDTLSQELHRNRGRAFTSPTIASSANHVIHLDEQVDRDRDRLEIPRGFDHKRFCFIMEIHEEPASIHHQGRTYLVSGFTDRMEFSKYTRSIPDDLDFHVNSLLETSGTKSINNNQLFGASVTNSINEDLLMLRPQDVISKYAFSDSPMRDGVTTKSFKSDTITGRVINSNSRKNTIPSSYLARTLSGIHRNRIEMIGGSMVGGGEGNNAMDDYIPGGRAIRGNRGSELENELEKVRFVVGEEHSDSFEFLLGLRRQSRHGAGAGIFTYRDLSKMCPDISDVIKVNTLDDNRTSRSGLTSLDKNRVGDMDGREWGEETQEELIATNVSNALVALCSSNFIILIDMIFMLRYDDYEERYIWDFEIGYNEDGCNREGSIMFVSSITEDMERDLIDRLANTMIDDVLASYSRYGYEVMVSVRYNMNREVFVSVAIDADEPYELCTAVFCDSIMSPSHTRSKSRGNTLGAGAFQLYQEVFRNCKL